MAGCERRCRCRAGVTGCLRRAGIAGGRVMGCPGRCLMLGGAGRWAGWRLAGVWVGGLMAGGGRWCGRMR